MPVLTGEGITTIMAAMGADQEGSRKPREDDITYEHLNLFGIGGASGRLQLPES